MKKTSLLLVLASSAALLAGCNGSKSFFGVGAVAYYDLAPRGNHVETTIDYVAVATNKKDVITHLRLDTVQLKAKATEGVIASTSAGHDDDAADIKSKWELLAAYNMKDSSPIGKEWYEQAEIFENWAVGKTVAEVKAALTGTTLTDGATIGVSINVNTWVDALELAFANKVEVSGKIAAIGVGGFGSASANRTTKAYEGHDWYVGGAAFDADKKVLAANIDTFQVRYVVDAESGRAVINTSVAQTDDENSRIKGKQELKDAYNMKPSSPIGKEWYEQAAALISLLLGKTVSEALGSEAYLENGADVGVTITIGGYRTTLLEAEQTAFNSRK